jgi:hypothetical protein
VRFVFAALISTACNSLPSQPPTYHHDIEPIFAARCQECHHMGGVAPVPLLDDYETARSYAEPISLAVETRWMPAFGANDSGLCGHWQDARWLTPDEISAIAEWQADGAPEGEPDTISAATTLPLPFHADAVADVGGVYHPGLGPGGNRCFVSDPGLSSDRLLSAIRVVSDDPRGVAQVTLFALDSDAAESAAAALDAADPGLGYGCFGTARTPDSRLVASWTWPTPILRMPAGTGVRLAAGRKLVVQIHYDVSHTGDSFASDTQVELQFDDRATEARVMTVSADGPLPPGLSSVAVEARLPVESAMQVVAIAPRMHIRGQSLTLLSNRQCLGSFEEWNFNDGQLFRAIEPARVEAGDQLYLSCAYRTLGRTAPVAFGDDIDDEECVAYLFVTP